MRLNTDTSGQTLFHLQGIRMVCPQLLLQDWCFGEKSHYSVVYFFEEGTARGVGRAVGKGEPGKPPSLQEKAEVTLCCLSASSMVNKGRTESRDELGCSKTRGLYVHSRWLTHSPCHHTRTFESLEHFSSCVTQWISSTALPVMKENIFCVLSGYSGYCYFYEYEEGEPQRVWGLCTASRWGEQ